MSRPSITPPPRAVGPLPLAPHAARPAPPGWRPPTLTARVTSGPRISIGGVDAVDGHDAVGRPSISSVGAPARPPSSASAGSTPPPQRGEGDRPVHGAGVEVVEAEAVGQAPGRRSTCPTRPARRWRSPSSAAMYRGPDLRSASSASKKSGNVLATQPGSAITMPGTRRPEERRSSSPCGGRRRSRPRAGRPAAPGRTTKPSASSSASTPQRRSSVTTAAMRSVSLPRMKPMPVTRRRPVGEGGDDGEGLARCRRGRRRSTSTPRSAPVPRPRCSRRRRSTVGAHPLEHVDEARGRPARRRRRGPRTAHPAARRWRRRRRSTTPRWRRARRRRSVAR